MNKLYTAQEVADRLKIKKTTDYDLIKSVELDEIRGYMMVEVVYDLFVFHDLVEIFVAAVYERVGACLKVIARELRHAGDLLADANMRSASKDFTVVLKSPRKMSMEECLDYINSDELLEITPKKYRMRKKILNYAERKKYEAKVAKQTDN